MVSHVRGAAWVSASFFGEAASVGAARVPVAGDPSAGAAMDGAGRHGGMEGMLSPPLSLRWMGCEDGRSGGGAGARAGLRCSPGGTP